jgi:hypothetical protein
MTERFLLSIILNTTKSIGVTVIFNKQATQEYDKRMGKARLERLGVAVLIGVSFYFGGAAIAGLVAVLSVLWTLREIEARLDYANFLKAHEHGLHDRLYEGR